MIFILYDRICKGRIVESKKRISNPNTRPKEITMKGYKFSNGKVIDLYHPLLSYGS